MTIILNTKSTMTLLIDFLFLIALEKTATNLQKH